MKNIRLTLTLLAAMLTTTLSAQSLQPVLKAYYGVKDALVATNAAKARTAAGALMTELARVEVSKLPVSDQKALATAKAKTAALGKTEDVDKQRSLFEELSNSMITLAKTAKPGKTYIQFCPMAANGKGASWLSDRKEVLNPYYGSKMLRCGTVKSEI